MAEHLKWAGTGVTRRRQVRRLRMCLASHPREASGHRPRQLCGAAFNGWTRCGRRAAKADWIRQCLRTRKHGPERQKSPRWSADRRGILTQISLRNLRRLDCVADVHAEAFRFAQCAQACLRRVTCRCAVRRSAPSDNFPGDDSPGPLGKGRQAHPSPDQNTGRRSVGFSLSPAQVGCIRLVPLNSADLG